MVAYDLNCPEITDRMDMMQEVLERMSPAPVLVNREYYDWQLKQVGHDKIFNRVVTLTGSTISIELPISGHISLKRIEMWFDSSNARTHNIRMHSSINPDAYAELDSGSGTTAASRFVDFGEGYVYLTPTKLVFNFSSYTADDKVNLQVLTKELV